MKTKSLFIINILYLTAMTLISLFYMFANFDKAISRQLGFAQLIFSMIVIVVFILIVCIKKDGLPVMVYILYSFAQCVPVFCWIVYSYATFQIFPGIVAVNWLGALIHLLMIAWGAGMIIIKKRNLT